jgi:hypothetical protein
MSQVGKAGRADMALPSVSATASGEVWYMFL